MFSATLNFLAFQIGWCLTAFGVAAGSAVWGALWILGWLTIHIRFQPSPRNEFLFLLCAALSGFVLDSILVLAGVLRFPSDNGYFGPSPYWMVLLWAGFAATLHGSMRWLIGRPALAALLGIVGGPLAYIAGIPFGAIAWGRSEGLGLFLVALEWAIAMPLLLVLEKRMSASLSEPLNLPAESEQPSEI